MRARRLSRQSDRDEGREVGAATSKRRSSPTSMRFLPVTIAEGASRAGRGVRIEFVVEQEAARVVAEIDPDALAEILRAIEAATRC